MNTQARRKDRREFARQDNRSIAAPQTESFLPEDRAFHEDGAQFGVGYGHSSGYVHQRPYTHAWGPMRFSIR